MIKILILEIQIGRGSGCGLACDDKFPKLGLGFDFGLGDWKFET